MKPIDVAKQAGVTRSAVHLALKTGRIVGKQKGRAWIVEMASARNYIKAQRALQRMRASMAKAAAKGGR